MAIRASQNQLSKKGMRVGFTLITVMFILGLNQPAFAARIKDLVDIQGVRQNQLVGYGLVVGLEGSGDGKKSKFTIQSMAAMLEQMGITVETDDIAVKNVAAVMVTADLPAFARVGSRIDILVSSIGDAKTLQGGTLLFTPLKGADGQIYAIAQGPVNTGGFIAGGEAAAVQKNFPTVGRVPNGALVEREIAYNFNHKKTLALALHDPDFTTVARITKSINMALDNHYASASDAGTIEIKVPDNYLGNLVGLVSLIERLEVTPDRVAKVVVNERTGTVVMGELVRISTVAIAHGNLSIEIRESATVSQPAPFARRGRTVTTPQTDISVQEEANKLMIMPAGVSIGEVVRGLNALGVSPRDLIAIFKAIKAAGALQATLEVI
jgi:flagellar P-ring protein precursor FlgI